MCNFIRNKIGLRFFIRAWLLEMKFVKYFIIFNTYNGFFGIFPTYLEENVEIKY